MIELHRKEPGTDEPGAAEPLPGGLWTQRRTINVAGKTKNCPWVLGDCRSGLKRRWWLLVLVLQPGEGWLLSLVLFSSRRQDGRRVHDTLLGYGPVSQSLLLPLAAAIDV